MSKGKRESLGRSDSTKAALDALARGGLSAVAVEPLAKELGTTKGSFYWHFADRNALLAATLDLWERRDTERVVAGLDDAQDVRTRLQGLLRLAFASVGDGSAGGAGAVELASQASASQPLVQETLKRVTRRRLEVLTQLVRRPRTLVGARQGPGPARLHRVSRPRPGGARHAGPPAPGPGTDRARQPDGRHARGGRRMSDVPPTHRHRALRRRRPRPATRRGCRGSAPRR